MTLETSDSIVTVANKRGDTLHVVKPELVTRAGNNVFVAVGNTEIKYYDCEDVVLIQEFFHKPETPTQ